MREVKIMPDIKVAAIQMSCSRDVKENIDKAVNYEIDVSS